MTIIDLNKIGKTPEERRGAIQWLLNKYGPSSEGQWKVKGLSQVVFKNDKDATFFILRWS
jgi:hypothetical protein